MFDKHIIIVDNEGCIGYNKNTQKELFYAMFFCVLWQRSKNH